MVYAHVYICIKRERERERDVQGYMRIVGLGFYELGAPSWESL